MSIELPPFAVLSALFSWIKTANGGSSMDTCQNCKPWQFYGHFSEVLKYCHKRALFENWFVVLASVHRTDTVGSFDPRKKVRIELQTVAVLSTLFKTAIYGRCAQVYKKL